jgi:hypothetical protein
VERGDISNTSSQRMVVIFEGLVGNLPSRRRREASVWRRMKQWKRYVGCWEWDHHNTTRVRDLTFHRSQNITLVSFMGEDCEDALQLAADRHHLGVRVECYDSAGEFARSLAYQPEVSHVVHTPAHWTYTFGSKAVTSLDELYR